MKRRRLPLAALLALGLLSGAAAGAQAGGRPEISVAGFSNQVSPREATAGARITVRGGGSSVASGLSQGSSGSGGSSPGPVVPWLAADSPLLQESAPYGPGSMWYAGPSGEECIYVPNASPACFVIVAASSGAAPAPDVSAIAGQVADQLTLDLAGIDASPPTTGLTGAVTWLWLGAAPAGQQGSVTLEGETVTVTADPSGVDWDFGDATTVTAGAGVPYESGDVPADAVTHVYQTRCLPGDQGNDPYVLPTCASDGYHVTASVTWTISYTASGPVSESGQLPSRTTSSELVYPVSEVRAFLSGGPQ